MAWFDGTYGYTKEHLEDEFPKELTKDLRQSADGMRLALINHLQDDDPLMDLADPKASEDEYGKHVFYHVFTGDDVEQIQTAVAYYYDMESHLWPNGLTLFRQDPERLFTYGNGHICKPLLNRQEELKKLLPKDFDLQQEIFILPLKRYMHSCPVCWKRTLLWRGDYMICPECGWEDDGTDNIDEATMPNGDYTIRTYRRKYLKLKKDDPNYHWWTPEFDRTE